MADSITSRIVADARVTPIMATCLFCDATLPEKITACDGPTMLLFAQCKGCQRVYVLDYARFGDDWDLKRLTMTRGL